MDCARTKSIKHWPRVDRAKIEVIEKLSLPTTANGVRSFLGHAGSVDDSFIKDFSKIVKPLCNLLEKDVVFKFDEACLHAFEEFKTMLTSTPMCDASDYAIGVVLG